MPSERAEIRRLMKEVTAAGHKRFGAHVNFRVYVDISDADPEDFDACLQYVKRPPGVDTDVMFGEVTEPDKVTALRVLLASIEKR